MLSHAPGRLLSFVSCLAFVLLLIGLPACAPAKADDSVRDSEVRIVHTTSILGYLEPCGCVAGRLGGLDRLSAFIETKRAEHPRTLFIDTGDLFVDGLEIEDNLRTQLPIKADTMLGAWGRLGCDAMAVGDFDLVLGPEVLKATAARHGVPLINANIVDAAGERLFEPYRIIEVGGARVGVFSLIHNKVRDPEVMKEFKDTPVHDVGKLLAEFDAKVQPFEAAAVEVLAELRPQVDLVVFASHLGRKRVARLLDGVEGIDLVIGGHVDDAPNQTETIAGVPHLMQHIRGSRASIVDLWWDSLEQLKAEQPVRWRDVSPLLGHALKRQVYLDDLALVQGREPLMGTEAFENELSLTANALMLHDAEPQPLDGLPGGPAFSHLHVPMYAGLGRSEAMLAELDAYHAALHDFWHATAPPKNHPNAKFVGPEACYACHPVQYEFWKATRHSRAYSTLQITQQEVDAECVACHTVGYERANGFQNPAGAAGFENVQCAACHEAGGDHIAGGAAVLKHMPSGSSRCDRCHNAVHHPDFGSKKPEMLLRVACPTMGLRESWPAAFVASLREGATAAELANPPDPAQASIAYQKVGDLPAALDTARLWLATDPASVTARLNLADCLIDSGKHEEAVSIVSKIVQRTGRQGSENEQAWGLYVDGLLVVDPPQALAAAREAYSLAPHNPRNAMRIAEACLAVGRRLDAVEALRAHLEARPQDRPILGPRLDEISGLGAQ